MNSLPWVPYHLLLVKITASTMYNLLLEGVNVFDDSIFYYSSHVYFIYYKKSL